MKTLKAGLVVGLLAVAVVAAAGCSSRELVRTANQDRTETVGPNEGLMPEVVVTAVRPMMPEVTVTAVRPMMPEVVVVGERPRVGEKGRGLELIFHQPEPALPYAPPIAQ